MPSYVNSRGEVVASAPLLAQLRAVLVEIWLTINLFWISLFNPAKNRRLKPSSSMQQSRQQNGWGSGGGRGGYGKGGGGGRSMGLSDFDSPTMNPDGACCGRTCG